jgi:hypothetical protein
MRCDRDVSRLILSEFKRSPRARLPKSARRTLRNLSANPVHVLVFGSKSRIHEALGMISCADWLPARSHISLTEPRDEAPSGSQRIVVMLPGPLQGRIKP